MNLEVVTYRAVEVDTSILQELAGIKSTQGLESKDLEASILELFPKYHKLKIFVKASPHDEDLDRTKWNKTTICMEVGKVKMHVPLQESAILTDQVPPQEAKEIDRLDGSLLMILEQVGVLAEPNNVCWRTGYFWSEKE